MKYIGLVLRPVSGTKFATVKIISAAKGVPIPDGKVLLEVSRAEDFYDCYITFDKIMPKGFGSAQIICSKFYRTDSPQPEEKKPEPKKKLSPEPQPKHLPAPELKPEPAPEPKPEPETAAEPEPDVEKLQQQVVSLRGNLTDKDITIDKLKKKIATLEKKLFDQKEMDKLNLGGNEELFSGEKKDFVLMALAEELEGLEPRTRRYDVLKGILDSNEYEQLLEKKREAVEKILKNYDGLSGTMQKDLEKLGLFITEYGAHYKIRYYGDSRYHATMAKTPSKNSDSKVINDIKKKML